MKAFLSHSSYEKSFVTQVFDYLGASQAHIDSVTFEKHRFNIDAIHKALDTSELFVLFISNESLDSSFVDYEAIVALEKLGSGLLRRIMLICIDTISLDRIDSKLRNLNIVTLASSVGACCRMIQSALIELDIETATPSEVFIGREDETKSLRKALTRPSAESPAVLVLSGIDGVGRTTLAKQVFLNLLPTFSRFVPAAISRNSGIDDLFRAVVRARGRTTVAEAARELVDFGSADYSGQVAILQSEVEHVLNENETLLLTDYGGLMDDEGMYHEYLIDVFEKFHSFYRPCAIFIQRRMPPYSKRKLLPSFHFQRVPPLDERETIELIGARLQAQKLSFTLEQVEKISESVMRHPINVEYAIDLIDDLDGDIDLFLKDTSDLAVWRYRRALDFVNRIEFSPLQIKICGLLILFNFLPTDIISGLCDDAPEEVAVAIRGLIDRHILEYNDGNYILSAPIVDAVKRSGRFDIKKEDERRYATELLNYIETYKDNDEISRSLLEPAVIASLRVGGAAQSQWRQFVLPSHYLVLAREAYDRRDLATTIDLCRLSLQQSAQMSNEALVECYRMLGLSAVRLGDDLVLKEARDNLAKVRSRYSRQVSLFLKGFSFRYKGLLPQAESAYLQCYDKNERNFSVCRELAQVYLALGRPSEAEGYARTAFEAAPNNPFILDVLVGVILGRAKLERLSKDEVESDRELSLLLEELKKYGNSESQAFYAHRMAEYHVIIGDSSAARRFASDAIKRSPWSIAPYLTRANILLMKGNEAGARRDITEANRLSQENTSLGNLYKIELFEIELDVLLTKKRYRAARNLMERIPEDMVPGTLFVKLQKKVAQAVAFDQNFHDETMIEWARSHL